MQSTCYQDLTGSLRVQVAEKFPSKADAAYPYSEVLHKSFLFYYQQRSGRLPHQVGPHAQAFRPSQLLRQPKCICELHQTSNGMCYSVKQQMHSIKGRRWPAEARVEVGLLPRV